METSAFPRTFQDAALTLGDFDFPLPAELIAQEPVARRDEARLFVLDRAVEHHEHAQVRDLPRWLRAGDLLVANDTRVMPARVFGRGPGGGAVELLLVRTREPGGDVWVCIGKPAKRLRRGTRLRFGDLGASVEEELGEGSYAVRFETDDLPAFLAANGEIPLPPYIQRPDGPLPFDRERYQTVYADKPGAIAAPTAGLHFTPELIGDLRAAGVEMAYLTLHVGPGTFRPIRAQDVSQHVMDPEWYEIPPATVDAMRRARARGCRIVAVGTTTTRALESCFAAHGEVRAGGGWANSYIRPGYRFGAIDALFTNFHLPESTLLLLVSALAGRERILAAYAEAIERRYRFYSYGDAMLIV